MSYLEKTCTVHFFMTAIILVFSSLACRNDSSTPDTTNGDYIISNEDFPNPERGFAPSIDPPWPDKVTWNFCDPGQDPSAYTFTKWTDALNAADLKGYREKGMSLIMVRYHIAEFRNKPVSQAFIDRLVQDFATLRNEGFKIIPRFVYNWPNGGPDAPLSVVLQHLDQLKPVLEQNKDVLASLEFGIIGCFGEMHNSHFRLIDNNTGITDTTRQLIAKVFETVPVSRMVSIRYPGYKFQYFTDNYYTPGPVLDITSAYSGTIQSRWSQHDDCLVCGEFNWGTYGYSKEEYSTINNFLEQDNQYLAQGGEPGGMDNPSDTDLDGDGFFGSRYADCARVVPLMERLHWSSMNVNYGGLSGGNAISYNTWKNQGCYNEISKRLGYRFALVSAVLPESAERGKTLSFQLVMKNTGFANLYNPRHIEVVLRNSTDGSVKRLRYQPSTDERLWFPQSGTEKSLSVSVNLPPDLAASTYDVLMNFPDPEPVINTRPEYSIRLANENLWDAATGYNRLNKKILIKL